MSADKSQEMYDLFLTKLKDAYTPIQIKDGVFGAHMNVEIMNDGPVTITLDSDK